MTHFSIKGVMSRCSKIEQSYTLDTIAPDQDDALKRIRLKAFLEELRGCPHSGKGNVIYSQRAFATLLGETYASIAGYERMQTSPDRINDRMKRRLAEVAGITYEEFLSFLATGDFQPNNMLSVEQVNTFLRNCSQEEFMAIQRVSLKRLLDLLSSRDSAAEDTGESDQPPPAPYVPDPTNQYLIDRTRELCNEVGEQAFAAMLSRSGLSQDDLQQLHEQDVDEAMFPEFAKLLMISLNELIEELFKASESS
jgi:hypothetical protein